VTYAAKISTSLFAYRGGEEDRKARCDVGERQGSGDRDEGREAPPVVRDPGGPQYVAVPANRHVGAVGKNGVEVRREHEWRAIFSAWAEGDNVAYGVPMDVGQAGLAQQFRHVESPDLFPERWSRNLSEGDLVPEGSVVRLKDVLARSSDVLLLQ
jgi:hypothetical protein